MFDVDIAPFGGADIVLPIGIDERRPILAIGRHRCGLLETGFPLFRRKNAPDRRQPIEIE